MPGRATTLTLLASDGAFKVTFSPALTPEHYTALEAILGERSRTMDEYCSLLAQAAEVWQVDFRCNTTGIE